MTSDLKPCPFCGGTPKLIDDRTAWYVECETCGVVVIGPRMLEELVKQATHQIWGEYKLNAVLRWNRRHHDTHTKK